MAKAQSITEVKRELAFLYKVAVCVHSLELEELLHEIVQITHQITKADSVLVYLLDKQKQTLVLRASKNPHKDLLRRITMRMGEGITGWVAKEMHPVSITQGAGSDGRFKLFHNLPEDKFEAFLSIPITNKHGIVGVLNVQYKKKHIHSKRDVNLLCAMGKLVGGVVENALLIEESMALKEALEIRKLIEKAKGVLMKRKGMDEEAAHRKIQQESMNNRKSIKEVAEAIILADKIDFQN